MTTVLPENIVLSEAPAIKGKVAGWRWVVEVAGIDMSWNFFKNKAKKDSIPHTWIGHAMYFSTMDLWNWLLARHSSVKPDPAAMGSSVEAQQPPQEKWYERI